MFGRNLPRARPGATLKASDLDAAKPDVEAFARLRAGPGLAQQALGGSPLLRLAGVQVAIARSGAGGIVALSGATPGSGAVTRYEFDGTSLVAGAADTAYNLGTGAVGGNKWLILLRCFGVWWVIFESC